MEHTNNHITVRGTLGKMPQFSHENHGKVFYRFTLEVARLSGAVDQLPIVAEEGLLSQLEFSSGCIVTVCGQIRSHNIRHDGIRRLLVFIFANRIMLEEGAPVNDVFLEGFLCREPIYRRTPLGREICDVMLAVPRPFKRADYLPCILWGRTAKDASQCHIKDRLQISGRLQSRNYTKVTEDGCSIERTAYEISALSAEILDLELL